MRIFNGGQFGMTGLIIWPSSHAAGGLWFFLFFILPGISSSFGSVAIPDSSLSQQYLVHVWQTDDGLPQNWVSSIAQTPDSYLWIGTRYGGLARFDGTRFVSFNPANTPELRDVQVEYVDVDATGALWIMMGNESVTELKDGQFHLYREPRSEPRLRALKVLEVSSNNVLFIEEQARVARLDLSGGQPVWQLLAPATPAAGSDQVFYRDGEGAVWYLTQAGELGCFHNLQFTSFPAPASPSATGLTALTLDEQKRLWVATASQIFRRSGDRFADETPTNGPPAHNIQYLVSSPNNGFWVRDGSHLRLGAGRVWVADAALPDSLQRDNNAHAPQLYCDADGNAWLIDYGHGLWCVQPDGSAFELTEKDGLPNAFITCWFQDRENNIWVGTAGGGMARISRRVVHVLGQDQQLPGKIARSVCVDQRGTLWAGTMSGGLAYWQNNRFIKVALPSFYPTTPLESVSVCPVQDGSLWIGTLRHGLMHLQPGGISRPLTPGELPSVRILFQDHTRRLWVGGLADLRWYENGQFKLIGSDEGFQSGIAVGAIAEDAQGTIWIGTGPGDLWKFQNGKFIRFRPPPAWPSFRFAALQADADGSVWVGTLGGGLLRFKEGRFFRFTGEQDLPNMYVSQLLEDHEGNLWAGTFAGIVRINLARLNAVADGQRSQLTCRVYGRSSGLRALECSSGFQPSCWASPEGGLWFSTADGVALIDPQARGVATSQSPPPVIIEEISVDGTPRPIPQAGDLAFHGARDQEQMQIEPGQHFVQFRFTGLSFAAPDEVSFRVKLEGAENQWRYLGEQRTVGYGPLTPGHYCLRVQACNSGGLWNEQGAALAFGVQPFFWQTWGFKAGLVVASLVLTALVITLVLTRRHRLELQKLRTQSELDRERARIAQDLHDDLGTSLTQISLLSSLANRETAREEVQSLNQQIRQRAYEMVVDLDEIVWAVNPRNDSLAELTNYLASFAEEFFRASPISCRLEIPQRLPVRPLSSETRHHLFLVFKESINNVARHSGATQVWINIELWPGEVVISVKDDGRGFEPAAQDFKPGNGLLNLRSRMEKIGGRTEVASKPGEGTAVVIHLPLA